MFVNMIAPVSSIYLLYIIPYCYEFYKHINLNEHVIKQSASNSNATSKFFYRGQIMFEKVGVLYSMLMGYRK